MTNDPRPKLGRSVDGLRGSIKETVGQAPPSYVENLLGLTQRTNLIVERGKNIVHIKFLISESNHVQNKCKEHNS